MRVLTLLKQANAQSAAHATEDQASSHQAQNKAERTEFELDVTEAPPTSDQLKNILEYLGGSPNKVIPGASDVTDAMRRLKADGDAFQRPLVSVLVHLCWATTNHFRWWIGTQARQVCSHSRPIFSCALI
jgi:hypothetical protein